MTADPDAYLGRAASERALAALERAIRDGVGLAALTGPPGLGKTLLLRVLARRLGERFRCVYLPYSALAPEGLCAWALAELGVAAGANPEAELLERAGAGPPLVLLLDDISTLPLATGRGLADLCAESRGAMRLVGAATDGVGTGAALATLGSSVLEVRLSRPMNGSETASYVRHRLSRVRVPPVLRKRFCPEQIAELHRGSGGVPRTVHRLATALLRADTTPRARDPLLDAG
jgi:general secretion pathway protein A